MREKEPIVTQRCRLFQPDFATNALFNQKKVINKHNCQEYELSNGVFQLKIGQRTKEIQSFLTTFSFLQFLYFTHEERVLFLTMTALDPEVSAG